MGRILYLNDPGSNSLAFIIEPDITPEENEINKREVEEAAINCAKQAYKEYLEQKDWGVIEWDEYLELQLSQYPTKTNVSLEEITEEEMKKMIYKDYFDLKFPNSDELFQSLTECEIKKMLFTA